ncbi:ATP-dependent RNA helicase HrpA [Pelomonas aquatica]|jgi:ATP-dependent helicase HrpA|uniref:ATP-dependent RNA helicase HrpA n=1 Tax=Pelomonas aquatica TaxID=431058 RepID=A0A9X4LDI2_9BURK|nr:ATP-dependent RNA helicase HrpA [Pelomonas aquatica]MCY4754786.1 ATP-dependent RNA helicase HrpA [Pelomonas aquatica]MDG0861901.1 ATP-dependent RNA helicase HrpA [Pelomonas aquatica]
MSSERPESRLPQPALSISFPESLPVSSRRDEIMRAMAEHQVVIVCGETGSGKTTQLPKIALAMGRGRVNGGGLIGHTQPRRIAASSVAKRIAEELNTPLGDVVGYKVRFQDRLSKGASVKLMTDGILLAETQSDPLLRAYDTLIIDEAHERSLNIDFLLGYLRELLPRRPDLKIVVTSATIDAERFAKHFESSKGPAPVLMVSGRLFPVEQRYRPFEESREYDLNNAICDAVDELWREGGGDVLVFLPGEREIREAAEALRKHHPPGVDILPLFSRLSEADQNKVFEPHGARRIVLATNVAETSLTVPGIRYVIDPGLARVKRYSYRNKVEQLLIENISQAAANQRAGRCGRVSNGICVRLFSEKEFNERPRFTDPEILRSSLAGVILRMKSLHLGEVERFPFIEAPRPKAIADGYQLLNELGATDDANELTPLGKELSRLPLDPRVGRMILEARTRDALTEVLVIASALSGQDVRDRPQEAAQAADEKHKKFDDEKSEFMGYLKLWKWLGDSKGGEGEHKLSYRKHEALLRENFVSPRRVREWRDVHSQLQTVVTEHGWRLNQSAATYEQVHLSMLSGLLGNIGQKSDDEDWYLGARGIKFYRHPGAHLSKKPGRWIVAAELVDTSRLYGRGLANIEPQWLPPIAGHLIKTQLLEPHWEKKAAEVVALERATLYGIVLYSGKRVNFGRVDPKAAREIFIREGLVNDELPEDLVRQLPFIAHNRRQISKVEALEHKSRRQDVLVDDELIYAFYDDKLPANVFSGATLLKWWREASKSNDKLLQLSQDELMRHEAAGVTSEAFPKVIRLGGVDCAVHYLHQPGDARDGLTVTVPIFALNQVSEERAEWLVPGMLAQKVTALLKSLHQKPRARLTPLPDFVAEFVELQPFCQGGLVDTLLRAVKDRSQLAVQRNDFKLEQLAPHLFMNFRVVDEHGRQLGQGRQLAALKAELGGQARSAFQALAALKLPAAEAPKPAPAPVAGKGVRAEVVKKPEPARDANQAYTDWTFGELPELLEVQKPGSGGQTLIGFPALIDKGAHVEIEVFDEPEVAAAKHRAGLRRLVALQLKEPLKFLEKNIPDLQRMSVLFMGLGTAEELRDQIIGVALDRAFLGDPLPTDSMSFKKRIEEGRSRLNLIAQEVARAVHAVLQELANATRKLKDSRPAKDVSDDIAAQLQRLVPRRFALDTPWAQLQHLPRYLKAITGRLDKLRADVARDAKLMAEVRPLEQRYTRRVAELKGVKDARLDDFRWQLEELRVSLFAQELRTPQPVSVKRLDKVWAQLTG